MMLSVIVPVLDEGDSVLLAYQEINRILKEQLNEYRNEIIFVDDGSLDDSISYLTDLSKENDNVKVIKLNKNYGSHMAIRAGLEHCQGDYACFLACDLQDPPANIPLMLEKLVEPIEVVWAVRDNRSDSIISKMFSRFFLH